MMMGFGLLTMFAFVLFSVLLIAGLLFWLARFNVNVGPQAPVAGPRLPSDPAGRACSHCGAGLQPQWVHCPQCGAPAGA